MSPAHVRSSCFPVFVHSRARFGTILSSSPRLTYRSLLLVKLPPLQHIIQLFELGVENAQEIAMTPPETLAQANACESQDSQAILEAYRAEFGAATVRT